MLANLTTDPNHKMRTLIIKMMKLYKDLQNMTETDLPVTIFAPDNAAFAKIPNKTLEAITSDNNTEEFKKIIFRHIISKNRILVADIKDGETKYDTVNGEKMTVAKSGHCLTVTSDEGIQASIIDANFGVACEKCGVIHVIDTVLYDLAKYK